MGKETVPVFRQYTVMDEAMAQAAQAELDAEDFDFVIGRGRSESWGDYVDRLALNRRGLALPQGWAASSTYGGFLDGQLAGRVVIRHEPDESAMQHTGHLGFAVRPAYRGRGLGAALCRHGLERLSRMGIKRALITCNATNAASRATIERCGGVSDQEQPVVAYQRDNRIMRFWVPCG
ncbi:GNAT family N-acetyltransferase [Glutamicibacter sp. MNS18]|uniref:GNAT family N-acetyltransferase n=1 Tax=Glutamicibacter sp. MNS18 TaxID=2989817 RepID=UPI002235B1A8|nr:GNAT family N-acetyltransferase [Glutamicibacter sp. MNS18]MCW4464312.1 GNAT family N-acetyltransferase [Glutamicibacter sp. MNS18]